MDDVRQLENQRMVAAVFFRSLAAEDATGLDLALANDLLESLANAGAPPEVIQYSCAFEGSERAAGRFLFGWLPPQLAAGGGAVDPAAVYRSLGSLAEVASLEGIDAIAEAAAAPAVRGVWLGFDARVDPRRSRIRFALSLAAGAAGKRAVAALLAELGLPLDGVRAPEVVTEIALEHGLDGPADLRLAWPVAPETVARSAPFAAEPTAAALVEGARQVRLVRSARPSARARLVLLYGPGDTGERQLTAFARRSPLAADFRREVRLANRTLPADAGLQLRPWGATLALEGGRPRPEHVAFLLRPRPLEGA